MPVSREEIVRGACLGSEFFPVERGYFITSSKDGLFLCGLIPETYYVGDPITRRWETLPPPPPPEGFPFNSISAGLVSNEEDDGLGGKVINFRVIIATGAKDLARYVLHEHDREDIPIETYSSRTREWRRSRLISDVPVNIEYGVPPSFSGGFLHWLGSNGRSIVAYDPSSLDKEDKEDHCNRGFISNKHVVQVISTPRFTKNVFAFSKIVWRSDNGQTMWFGRGEYDRGVEVFRKRDESDEWACISRVASIGTMTKGILGITQKDIDEELVKSGAACEEDIDDKRRMVRMMAFIPWNPRLVMMWYWNRIYVYDCIKKKLDHEVVVDGDRHFTDRAWEWTPYFHSLAKSDFQSQERSPLLNCLSS